MNDRLQKFARLVEIGSFTRAAKDLRISQPALTLAINKLERELRAPLLIRANRKLELTEAGESAYRAALEHQNVSDQLYSNLNRIAKKRPNIHIGMTDSVASLLCTTDAFGALESAADVTIVVNNSRYLRDAVERRNLDMAFIVSDELEHQLFQSNIVGFEKLIVVCHPSLLGKAASDLKQGKLSNFICYDKPSTTYGHIQQTLQGLSIRLHTSLYSTSPDIMLRMVLSAKGIAALPEEMVQASLKGGVLSALTHQRQQMIVKRPIAVIALRGKSLVPALTTFQMAAAKLLDGSGKNPAN